uniref:Uncharacterized protein n=1 Tax=Oryza brachyantha TaxID=4533 RepID=J3KZX3_ORYBR
MPPPSLRPPPLLRSPPPTQPPLRPMLSPLLALPPPESLLVRLDQIDLRVSGGVYGSWRSNGAEGCQSLRCRPVDDDRDCDYDSATAGDHHVVRCAPGARHRHTKSLLSALQQWQVKGNLLNRLNLLKSCILFLCMQSSLNYTTIMKREYS